MLGSDMNWQFGGLSLDDWPGRCGCWRWRRCRNRSLSRPLFYLSTREAVNERAALKLLGIIEAVIQVGLMRLMEGSFGRCGRSGVRAWADGGVRGLAKINTMMRLGPVMEGSGGFWLG